MDLYEDLAVSNYSPVIYPGLAKVLSNKRKPFYVVQANDCFHAANVQSE